MKMRFPKRELLLSAPLLLQVVFGSSQQPLTLLDDDHWYFARGGLEGYSLRIKEHTQAGAEGALLCDAGSKQYTGWLDVSEERSLFFCKESTILC